jgi:alkaline phosphatase
MGMYAMLRLTYRKAAAAACISLSCFIFNASADGDNNGWHNWNHRYKYVFLFIGDGMASPQIHATEAYLAQLNKDDADPGSGEGDKAVLLNMSELPFVGSQLSYANNRFITGSAAAGTALSCGIKTDIGVIAQDPDDGKACTTLAEAAKAKGMKVGIVSSVSIDHATPAVYYAHEPSRNNYEQIGEWLLESDFDYFGGGGFRVNKYTSPTYAGKSDEDRYAIVEQAAVANGFTFANTRPEFHALQPNRRWWRNPRAIAVNPYLDSSNAIPYALNVEGSPNDYPDSISLAEFTQKGIDLLDNPRGFFMMVEGGKIDWAAHANDARAVIDDTIAFDDAVAVAMDFAETHPRTLIVVTGDHECGGMTLGFAGTAYDSAYEILAGQVLAYDDFDKILEDYKESNSSDDVDEEMWGIILDNFGLDGDSLTNGIEDDLTDFQKVQLEEAFDQFIAGMNANSDEENNLLYGYYNPLSVTLTHILNNRAGLAFTSFSHTSVPVPVMSNDPRFDGYYENTEVANRIAEALGVDIGD